MWTIKKIAGPRGKDRYVSKAIVGDAAREQGFHGSKKAAIRALIIAGVDFVTAKQMVATA